MQQGVLHDVLWPSHSKKESNILVKPRVNLGVESTINDILDSRNTDL